MVAMSPHYVVSTASTRFDDGEKFLTAELARAADKRNEDEGTHGFVGGDADTEAEDVGRDSVGGGANDSQTEGEEEEREEEGAAAVANPGAAAAFNIWGKFLCVCRWPSGKCTYSMYKIHHALQLQVRIQSLRMT